MTATPKIRKKSMKQKRQKEEIEADWDIEFVGIFDYNQKKSLREKR